MATQLLDGLVADWKPQQYHDTYTEELRQRIISKDKRGSKRVEEADEQPAERAEVLDLMAALQASVDASKQRRKKAPAKRKSA